MSANPRYLLGLLFLISVINMMDRQVLSILQEDIRLDLGLTDSQLGSLSLGFGILYAVFALPIGRLADTGSRKGIIIACMSLWSVVTSATALVQNYAWLMAARMGVAVGEAGVNPTAHSLISDSFPFNQRATAIAVFGAGIPIGLMLAITLGGLISDAVGWKYTFLFFGLPGLIVAAVMYFTAAEPKRGGADGIENVADKLSVGQTLRRLAASRAYVFLVAGTAAQALVGYAVLQWLPSYYIRTFGLTTAEVAVRLGPVIGIVGIVGILATAYLGDRLARLDPRWYLWLLAIAMLIAYPVLSGALFVNDFNVSLTLFSVQIFAGTAFLGISNALVQSLAPIRMRGIAAAIKTLCLNVIGMGIGAQLVGLLSDAFASAVPGESLRSALLIIALGNLVALVAYLMSARYLVRDLASARADSEASV